MSVFGKTGVMQTQTTHREENTKPGSTTRATTLTVCRPSHCSSGIVLSAKLKYQLQCYYESWATETTVDLNIIDTAQQTRVGTESRVRALWRASEPNPHNISYSYTVQFDYRVTTTASPAALSTTAAAIRTYLREDKL